MTEIYLHIFARMADYIHTHPYHKHHGTLDTTRHRHHPPHKYRHWALGRQAARPLFASCSTAVVLPLAFILRALQLLLHACQFLFSGGRAVHRILRHLRYLVEFGL